MIAIAAILIGIAGPSTCDERLIWETWLTSQFNQYYAFTTQSDRVMIDVWIDPNEGDWTFLGQAGSQYCEIMHGEMWPVSRS